MRSICKNPECGKHFNHERAGARYCSDACRVAAHRKRQAPLPDTAWCGDTKHFRSANAELADRLCVIAVEADDGDPKTGRRFYYVALSYGYIQPDMSATDEGKKSRESAYKRVLSLLGDLRKAGRIEWDMVIDLTRDLVEWETFTSPREARAEMREQYDEDRWLGQPYYPVLIVEKDTMEPVCKPMASRWQMPFASSRGYGSLTLQHDVAEKLNHRFAKTGQRAKVYFVSDLDASGLDLQRSWEQALKDFGVQVQFVRIALTRAQVQNHVDERGQRLKRLSIEVKDSDTRSKSYIAQYGNRCWEADILPGQVIQDTLDADIRSWLDRDLWLERDREITLARWRL
jgi:hypothetical protein